MPDGREPMQPIKVEDILTAQDLEELKQVEVVAESVKEIIARAKEADIDLGDAPERIDKAQRQARAIRQAFFPGQ